MYQPALLGSKVMNSLPYHHPSQGAVFVCLFVFVFVGGGGGGGNQCVVFTSRLSIIVHLTALTINFDNYKINQ